MAEARGYRSPRRQQQAENTRSDILAAARRLFSQRGYSATGITDIAAEAGVSVPTLYTSIGAKASIALALVAFIDAEVEMDALAGAEFQAVSGKEVLRANARLTRVLNEQCGDIIRVLLSAAVSDPEVASAAALGRKTHRQGCRMVVEHIHSLGELSADLTLDQATAILATSTAPEVIDRFTIEHGWSFDEVEAWLTKATPRLLLQDRFRAG